MIYRGYKIGANVPEWNQYGVTDDGEVDTSDFRGEGGVDFDSAEFDIYENPDTNDEQLIDGGYGSVETCKRAIDALIKNATTFQSEAGN